MPNCSDYQDTQAAQPMAPTVSYEQALRDKINILTGRLKSAEDELAEAYVYFDKETAELRQKLSVAQKELESKALCVSLEAHANAIRGIEARLHAKIEELQERVTLAESDAKLANEDRYRQQCQRESTVNHFMNQQSQFQQFQDDLKGAIALLAVAYYELAPDLLPHGALAVSWMEPFYPKIADKMQMAQAEGNDFRYTARLIQNVCKEVAES